MAVSQQWKKVLKPAIYVLDSRGVVHISREREGEHTITKCGRYVCSPAMSLGERRGKKVCRVCSSRRYQAANLVNDEKLKPTPAAAVMRGIDLHRYK